MAVFDNELDAKKAIMKLISVFTKNVEGLDRVELDNFVMYAPPQDTYYAGYVFYVNKDSIDQETAERIHGLKHHLNDTIKKYLGVTLIANSSEIKTLNSTIK